MNPRNKVLVTLAILAVLTLAFFYSSRYISEVTGKSILGWITHSGDSAEINAENLAKCLTEQGVIMYSSSVCSHCKSQKEEFGDAVQYLKIIECSENAELCSEKNLLGVPAWEINGEIFYGKKSLKEIAELAEC